MMKIVKTIPYRVITLFVLILTLSSLRGQDVCHLDLLKSDLVTANSDEVFKHFDDFPDEAYHSWKVIKDFPKIKLSIPSLQSISRISKRFIYNNKTGYEGLEELFKIVTTSNIDGLISGLNKADEIFDASIPVTISAKKSGSQIFANVVDEEGNQVCRFIAENISKKQIVPDGVKVGSYDGLDIIQNGKKIGFAEEIDWVTTGTNYKDVSLGKKLGDDSSFKDVYEISENTDKAIAILKPGKNVKVINDEIDALKTLSDNGFPTVSIIEKTTHNGSPAIVMQKYELGSEKIVDVFGSEVKVVGESNLLSTKSIESLTSIRKMMLDKQVSIDDLQFLIKKDGSFVIADPVGVKIGTPPSEVNLKLLDELIAQANKVANAGDKWLDDLSLVTKSELEDYYKIIKEDPPFQLTANTPAHKAQRWEQFPTSESD